MCLEQLSKNDKLWREFAFKICGNKNRADELVQDMYIRRYENGRDEHWNEYYVFMVLRSIYLNDKKTNKRISKEIIHTSTEDVFEPNDYEQGLLDKVKGLTFNQRELLELSFDYSLRGIQERFGVSYGYAYRELKKAREILLNGDLSKYNNKRLKHKKMSKAEKDEAYYESLDKRSREYKTYMAGKKSVGLGDTVAKVTKATGIDKAVKKVVGDDCGCKERQAKLNELFRYKERPLCMDDIQLRDYDNFYKNRTFKLLGGGRGKGSLTAQEVTFVCELFSAIFRRELWIPKCTTCAGTLKTLIAMIIKLDTVYVNSI